MKGGRRESTEGLRHLLRTNATGFCGRFVEQHVCEDGTRCDSSYAPLRFESRGGDPATFDPHRKPDHIAANGIRHLDRCRSIKQVAGIVWAIKMSEYCFVKHGPSIRQPENSGP